MDLYRLVPAPIKKYVSPTFFRYGVMAVIVVAIEIASFWLLNSPLHVNYLVATVLSQLVGIVLNWVGSRYYVFGASRHRAHKEFGLVFATSLVGVGLQSATVYIVVGILKAQPLLGKLIAIVITFFWNYFVRKRYIYKHPGEEVDLVT